MLKQLLAKKKISKLKKLYDAKVESHTDIYGKFIKAAQEFNDEERKAASKELLQHISESTHDSQSIAGKLYRFLLKKQEYQNAATTIQAAFKDRKVRKELALMKKKKSKKVTRKDQEGNDPLCPIKTIEKNETPEAKVNPGFWKKALLLTSYVIKQLLNALTLLIHFDLRVFSNAHKDFKANWNQASSYSKKPSKGSTPANAQELNNVIKAQALVLKENIRKVDEAISSINTQANH
ncbi:hypothetical protein MMH89_01655 [Candidatus Comchoanobacter bicostacola]|uniref:Uncharacterized protein n=1 Tax=Candidatus Comchoanobacter bicostacola TaxID=2919598 RepID=A0ABY5DK45_9GAMM|nr:hypothetical protein [Candidatus Comchoanobacter bicostacola]UTC24856.1 hypothetical protein MMH89_01655 [Candidatus Comchoanobacter bicostacola]